MIADAREGAICCSICNTCGRCGPPVPGTAGHAHQAARRRAARHGWIHPTKTSIDRCPTCATP